MQTMTLLSALQNTSACCVVCLPFPNLFPSPAFRAFFSPHLFLAVRVERLLTVLAYRVTRCLFQWAVVALAGTKIKLLDPQTHLAKKLTSIFANSIQRPGLLLPA